MNLLLISKHEISDNNKVILTGRRQQHIRKVLKLGPGDRLKSGIIDGFVGQAEMITHVNDETIELRLDENSFTNPPEIIPCTLILAMPRPKMMRRVIQNISAMGIKQIHLINSWRVEKSFWQTPWLQPEMLREQLILGLEQSIDTKMPDVQIHKLFKPFAEDVLPGILSGGSRALVAHPYSEQHCPVDIKDRSSLIIGPEGGFTDYEISMLQKAGAEAVNTGPRILRVETAIPALVSRLYPS